MRPLRRVVPLLVVAAALAACGPRDDARTADRPADPAPAIADTSVDTNGSAGADATPDTAARDTTARDTAAVARTPERDPWLFEGIPNFEDLVATRDGDWLVVLASVERTGARPKPTILRADDPGIAAVQQRAWDVRDVPFLVASEELPAFAPGRVALVLGPFPRADAERRLADVRAYAPDAYLKAGW